MFAGVTFNFFVINAAVTTELFLLTRSFVALPAAVLIHASDISCACASRGFSISG